MDEPSGSAASSLPTANPSRMHGSLILAVVFAAAIAMGWPTLNAGFTSGDDQRFVTEHFLVAHPSWPHAVELFSIIHGDLYQPLPMLTFLADYGLAEPQPADRFGIEAGPFHRTNVLLHGINAILAALLAWRLSQRPAIGLITGLLFATHPFAVESVAWVSGRMMLLATLFALLTILLCLRASTPNQNPPRKWGAAGVRASTVFTWLASLLSKVLPTVPLAAAWLEWRERGTLERRAKLRYGLLLALAVAGVALAAYTSRQAGFSSDDAEFNASPAVRAVLACRYYLENYVVPTGLSPWSPPPDDLSLTDRDCLVGLAEIATILIAALLLRRRSPSAFLGITLFAILFVPFLAAPAARRFLAADRYMYLPIIGLHFAVASLLVTLSDWLDLRLKPAVRHRYLVLPTMALVGPCLLFSWNLSPAWADTISRDSRVAYVYPDNPLSHYELAKACNFSDRPHDALDVIAKARRRWPDHPRLAAQAGEAHRLLQDWPAAERELRFASERMPGHTSTRYHLALAIDQNGRRDEAIQLLNSILETSPGFLPGWSTLGKWHLASGNDRAADDAFSRALAVNPNHRDALLARAEIRMKSQDWTGAIELLRRIMAYDPTDAQASFQLAVALVRTERYPEAFDIYSRLIAADENNVMLRFNRAAVAEQLGRLDVAEGDYLVVVTERPESLDAYVALHQLLCEQRRFDRLLEVWEHRYEILPQQDETLVGLAWALALTDRLDRAEQIVELIDDQSPMAEPARFALAFGALQRGDHAAMRVHLDAALSKTGEGLHGADDWRARLIQASIGTIQNPLRQTRPARYLLVCFLYINGKQDLAGELFRRIADENPKDEWSTAAEQRIREIDELDRKNR